MYRGSIRRSGASCRQNESVYGDSSLPCTYVHRTAATNVCQSTMTRCASRLRRYAAAKRRSAVGFHGDGHSYRPILFCALVRECAAVAPPSLPPPPALAADFADAFEEQKNTIEHGWNPPIRSSPLHSIGARRRGSSR